LNSIRANVITLFSSVYVGWLKLLNTHSLDYLHQIGDFVGNDANCYLMKLREDKSKDFIL